MKLFGMVILSILVVIVTLAIGGGLIVLLAFGVGWALNHIMRLEPFQATIISLAGILVFGILVERAIYSLANLPKSSMDSEYDDDFDEEDDDEFDDEFDDDFDDEDDAYEDKNDLKSSDEEMDKLFAGIPRWRRPLRNLDFSNTKPDDRCPCGSGRKYKNCHGRKSTLN